MNKSYDFTEGALLRPLLFFSLPIMGAVLLQSLYGAVDTLIVGRFGDASSVSAVATGSQIIQTINGIVTGMTMGTTVAIGQKIGEKDDDGAGRTVGATLWIFVFIAIAITVLLFGFARPLAALLHTPAESFDKTVSYVKICALGAVFTTAYNVISGIMRGIGNAVLPLIFVSIACITNILGDLLLVGLLGMDASGAAIATVSAQGLSALLSLLIIGKQGLPFAFSLRSLHFDRHAAGQILCLGTPIAAQDALSNLSFLIITAIINSLGVVYSASIGVGERITFFANLLPMTFISSMSAVTAQNIGAGKHDRAVKALCSAALVSLSVSLLMSCTLLFFGDVLSRLFTSDEAVISGSALYLKAYALDCPIVAVLFCFIGYFNGCGKTFFVMVQGLTSAFLVRIPVSYLVSQLPEMNMFQIGLAPPAAALVSLVISVGYYWKTRSQRKRRKLMWQNFGNRARDD